MENHMELLGVKKSFVTVLSVESGIEGLKNPKKRNFLVCECVCGKIIKKTIRDFNRNSVFSCGCKTRKINTFIDGRASHELYNTYKNMIYRCYNPSHKYFKNYGGRGISVCENWLSSFRIFVDNVGERPLGMSLDRIDNDGNYEPGNVRWATHMEQCNNRSKSYLPRQK